MLAVLAELAPSWRLDLHAVHVNHGLRGEEAEEDARFAARLSAQLGVPFRCEPVDLTTGRVKGRSLQEWAREIRYDRLTQVGRDLTVHRIALGHTADDQAETLLMWMLRGAGTAGLGGIPPAREGRFIRPLLEVSRSEILEYLEARALPYRTDSSNVSPKYLRNRIRHELIPALKRFNPSIVEVLRRQAELFREDDRCLEQWVSEQSPLVMSSEGPDRILDRAGLLALPLALQRRLTRALIRQMSGVPNGPSFRAVASVLERVVHGRSGSALTVQRLRIARQYDRILFSRVDHGLAPMEEAVPQALRVPSVTSWPPTGQSIRIHLEAASRVQSGGAPRDPTRRVLLDADRLTTGRLVLRTWQPGDWFQPMGMQGRRKKLQDFFADLKVPRHDRARVPLVVAPEGIVWIAGARADHRFRATPATARYLIVELLDGLSEAGAR